MALTRCPQLIPLGPSEPWPARPQPLRPPWGPGRLAVFPLPLAPQWLVAVPLGRERLDLAVEAVPRGPPLLGELDRQDLPVEGAVHPNPGGGEREEVFEPGGDRTHAVVWPTSRSTWLRGWTGPGIPATACSRSRRSWNAARATAAGIGRSGFSRGLASRLARMTSMAGDCSRTAAMGVGSVAGVWTDFARSSLGIRLLAVSGLEAEFHAGSPGWRPAHGI